VPELADAASRTGDAASLRAVLEWLSERTRVTPSEWEFGIEHRVRALLSEGEGAEVLYRESTDHLGRLAGSLAERESMCVITLTPPGVIDRAGPAGDRHTGPSRSPRRAGTADEQPEVQGLTTRTTFLSRRPI
jgi:hypothetical protein